MTAKFLPVLVAIVLALSGVSASAQEEPSKALRMAQAFMSVCMETMLSARAIDPNEFAGLLVVDRVEGDQTWLKQARGQPWVRLSINGSTPGSCGMSFSVNGAPNSLEAAQELARLLREAEGMANVSVRGMNGALTPVAYMQTFDRERDPYVAYVMVAGYHTFMSTPARAPQD